MEHIQPPELFPSQPFGFTQVVTSPPGRLVFVSGQVALDKDLQLVGGTDLVAQTEQALANLARALDAAGAARSDVAFLRLYVVGYQPEHAGLMTPLLQKFFGDAPPPAQTLLGVQALGVPGLLIELEALAVVGSSSA